MQAAAQATDERRNGPWRVSALQRTAPDDGKGWEGLRVEVHGQVPQEPPHQEPGTQYFELVDDDSAPELSGLEELRAQVGIGRHTGVGFELVRRSWGANWMSMSLTFQFVQV